ncbi:MAG: ABC transporter substrate-binding protein [Roseiarcus sp.]|uniref:ABC transporter substrate-binding protein n=1 Tax=Roseiarcus sp. TaxID=1969460 RepID=UPI003BB0EE90
MKAITLAGLGLAVALAGAGAASAKTLVYCSEGSPENFTPSINTTGTSFDAARPVYNRLTEFKRGTTEVVPGLAESWDITDGGKTITFHLRKGVKFHSLKDFKPTRDFNADDVLWSFNRQWKPDHPYYKVSGGKYDYFNDMDMPTLLDSVEKTDDYTVVMKLKTPNVAILANLAMDFMAIGSAEYADFLLKKGTPEQFDQAPVGTGPFSFVAYQKDSVIRYKANPDYYGEKPLVDDLVFAITPDATARYAKLKAGECHVNAYPRPADLAEMKADNSLKVISASGLNIAFWAFNVTKPPLDNVKVRQALALAIDRDAIIKDVYLGAGEKAKTLIPRTMWSYDDAIPDVPYDPAKAAALLKEAGVATPFDIDLWYQPVQRPYNPNGKRIGEMMQADLAKIGVNAKLVTYEWGEYRKRAQGGEDMTAQLGWTGDNGDPDNFFFLDGCTDGKPASNNIPKWCNAEYNDLLVKARVVADQAERAKLYQRMQEIEHDEQPELLVAHSIVSEAMRANVEGYKQSPLGTHAFEGVDLK